MHLAAGIDLNLLALLLDYMEGYVAPTADKCTDNHMRDAVLVVLHRLS